MKVFLALALLALSVGCAELVTLAHLGVAISNSMAKHRELSQQQKIQATPTPEGK